MATTLFFFGKGIISRWSRRSFRDEENLFLISTSFCSCNVQRRDLLGDKGGDISSSTVDRVSLALMLQFVCTKLE